MADRSARAAARRRRLRRRAIVGAGVVVIVGAGAGTAWALTGSSGPRYRLATVTRGNVSETVDTVGTIVSTNRAAVTFPVAGTVAAVSARVGQAVTAGQQLASLNTTALSQKVNDAASTLANAQQTLAEDEAVQAGTATTSSATSSSGTSSSVTAQDESATPLARSTGPTSAPTRAPGGTGPVGGSGPVGGTGSSAPASGGSPATAEQALKAAQQDLTKAQQQLVAAQKALDAALNAVGKLTPLAGAGGACAALTPAPRTVTAVAGADGSITVTADPGDVVSIPNATTPTPSGDEYRFTGLTPAQAYTVTIQAAKVIDAAACGNAIAAIVAAAAPAADGTTSLHDLGTQLTAAQTQLQAALGKLAAARATGTGSPGTAKTGSRGSAPSPGAGSASGTGNRPSGGTRPQSGGGNPQGSGSSSGTGQKPTRTVTAQQITADQAAIDAANANLAMVKQNLAQAVIVSPIAGTVAAVSLTAGGSSSGSVTVIGRGGYLVNTTVPLTDIDQVALGQHAAVTVDGVTGALAATVTYVGPLGSTSGSTTSYPVTISLAATERKLFDGTGAGVAITTGQVSDVLTVPTSAVHSLGALRTVTVVDHGTASVARVTVGASGPAWTEIRSGLAAGQQVLLADLSEPIPTSGTPNNGTVRRLTGGGLGGGLGGGGLGGGLGGRTGR